MDIENLGLFLQVLKRLQGLFEHLIFPVNLTISLEVWWKCGKSTSFVISEPNEVAINNEFKAEIY